MRENFSRLRDGMTRADVETIFGPPGDHSNGPTQDAQDYASFHAGRETGDENVVIVKWKDDTAEVSAVFDDAGILWASCHRLARVK
jgi:hypothetical protein